jgi:hypothetical protein
MIKKITVLLVLFLLNFGAFAEWVQQGSNSEVTVYFNSDGIINSNETIRVWYLFDYRTPKIDAINFPYSSREFFEFNCQIKIIRNLSLTWFSGNMGQGTVNRHYDKASEWRNVAPDTFEAWLSKNACAKLKP